MMDHILQHDWCDSGPDTSFLNPDEIDDCAINRILENRFRDPMLDLSSDSEDERPRNTIDWTNVFQFHRPDNPTTDKKNTVYVAGLRQVPPYPKLSALTKQQHFNCLKVLCAQNPNVSVSQLIPRPKNYDHRVFQDVQEKYLNEQKEYLEWAKTMWTTNHSSRALRPKPITENVYEAEFKMRESSLQSFPKNFEMVAHISLTNLINKCQMRFKQDLVKVNISDLPKAEIPNPFVRKFLICQSASVPDPCNKHPCWFILPNEKAMTVLPLTEIHRELGQFAVDNNTQIVASESALKCLVEMDRDWTIPISVVEAISLDGDTRNVLILGSEFSTNRKSAMERTYRAFRHLLTYAFIPLQEKEKMFSHESDTDVPTANGNATENVNKSFSRLEVTSDEDDDHLVINESIVDDDDDDDDDERPMVIDEDMTEPEQTQEPPKKANNNAKPIEDIKQAQIKMPAKAINEKRTDDGRKKNSDDFYSCTCKDSMFRNPPPRSFRKWEVKNNKNGDTFDMIVHCSHKLRGSTGEIITEPIVEYQIDLGGSKQSSDKIKSLALSLLLRENASLVNARVENFNSEVVTMDTLKLDDLTGKDPDILTDVSNIMFGTLNQLQSLLPGHYILQHEVNHGANALLYATKIKGIGQKLCLNFDCAVLAETDEAKSVKNPPVLTDVLLPVHKYRKILPLAFPPFPNMVTKESKKQPVKTKAPPQAIRWPKKKKKKTKKNY